MISSGLAGDVGLPVWVDLALSLLAWSGRREPLSATERERLARKAEGCLSTLRQKDLDSLFYLSCAPAEPAQRMYDKVWRAQRQALLELAGELDRADIPYIHFKGTEIRERFYGSRALGLSSDCDLLVQRTDVVGVQRILYGLGYRPGIFDRQELRFYDRDIAEIASIEAQHYELPPFNRLAPLDLDPEELAIVPQRNRYPAFVIDGRPHVILELDIHHGVATDIDSEDLFAGAVAGPFPCGLAPAPADHLWFLTSRYYTEVAIHGKASLRDFGYIAPLVCHPDLDWDRVLAVAEKYELHCALFYFLGFLDRLSGGPVPREVLDRLRPTEANRLRDWGWLLGKLFGFVDPFPFAAG